MQYATLNNDVKMPVLGLGTFMLAPDDAQAAVTFALVNGYELIDTANAYVNEKAVGRGILASGRAREEVFLETKLWPCFYESKTAVDETLARLGTDYADLMILHQPAADYIHGYQKLEAAYKAGKLRAIGISNFNAAEVEEVVEKCEVVPAVVQVECHPYFPQTELRRTLAKHGIALQAWYPLGGRGNASIMVEAVIAELAAKHGKSAAQVIMRWHVQMGNIVIPGSKTEAHILDNLDIFDFDLTGDDMAAIATLDRGDSIYHRTDEQLAKFAAFVPDVDGQK
ncbi:aldo/keto reductase [Paratractidigestivibacter sp.]|uniref:aldo/keto reductase n=1 Tax=Paratractidigestivibacter sp. TaxID=2847316 RepID=UPI002AC9E639|nr:aldo/keto reductase [Paratractidigestivibacter sp.]